MRDDRLERMNEYATKNIELCAKDEEIAELRRRTKELEGFIRSAEEFLPEGIKAEARGVLGGEEGTSSSEVHVRL